MKKIFIDGGARIGESIEILINKRGDMEGCEIHFYECNPNHFETLKNIKLENHTIYVYPYAIWNKNEIKKFYLSEDRWGDLGCTLKPEKKEKLNLDTPINVECKSIIDIIDEFNDDDYIVLKLDIEGSEYEVLEELLVTNKINKINELFVEFHDSFFNLNSNNLKSRLLNTGIKCDFSWQ